MEGDRRKPVGQSDRGMAEDPPVDEHPPGPPQFVHCERNRRREGVPGWQGYGDGEVPDGLQVPGKGALRLADRAVRLGHGHATGEQRGEDEDLPQLPRSGGRGEGERRGIGHGHREDVAAQRSAQVPYLPGSEGADGVASKSNDGGARPGDGDHENSRKCYAGQELLMVN